MLYECFKLTGANSDSQIRYGMADDQMWHGSYSSAINGNQRFPILAIYL